MSNSNSKVAIERLLSEDDIVTFQHRMDSIFYPQGRNSPDYGIHAGGHAGTGGDMSDFFASSNDPIFWLHHGMVDLLWTTWQARDPPHRQYALNGTDLLQNDPAGTTVSVDYVQNFGYLDQPRKLGGLMDTQKGQYCYRYEY
nr:tyrosinase-like protein orsC [Quercus suber]